jgi:hypothetical protein
MRLLGPVILILLSTVNNFRHQLSMRHTIASQFIRHDLPGLSTMTAQQPFEEAFSRCAVTSCLQIHINNFTVLIHSPP